MPTEEDKKILEKNGWTVECESPFEIRHEDGSFASGQAAIIVTNACIEDDFGRCRICGGEAEEDTPNLCGEHQNFG